MIFREAVAADIEVLNTISIRSKAYWGYPEAWMEHWLDELSLDADKLASQHVLVLEGEEGIIGFSSIAEEEQCYEILHLWILPKYIGKGLGKMLLNETIQAFVKSAKEIIVEADPNAEPFYQSQGFVTYGKVESYPKGRFLPVMRRAPEVNIASNLG